MVLISLLLVYLCVFVQGDFSTSFKEQNDVEMATFFETFINIVLIFVERVQWFEREIKIDNYLLEIRHYSIHHFFAYNDILKPFNLI